MKSTKFVAVSLAWVMLATPVSATAADEPVAAVEEEVAIWLDRMARALREESYEGIFTYMRGYRFDTVKVAHEFRDGEEMERLVNLNGEPREVIRHGSEVVCRHENSEHVELEHEVMLGPFTHAFNKNLATYQALYDFAMLGEDRVAGRNAVRLSISPKNNDRYGYRLWLDKETGLLLQSHLVDRGRVREVFQFSRVEIGDPIRVANLESAFANAVEHPLYVIEADPSPEQASRPEWKVSWLPTGFRQVRSRGPDRILFSDGIATISVFVEHDNSANLGDMTTNVGGTVVITRRLKDSQQITVVGEVPVDTARKIANSVEPVIY